MNLQENIKRILREETDPTFEKTPLEKSIMGFVDMVIQDYILPENFYGVVADLYNDGRDCTITGLFKGGSYGMKESDEMHNILRKIIKELKEYYGGQFDFRTSTSTIESYMGHLNSYYKLRK